MAPFSYTDKEETEIRRALEKQGFKDTKNWPQFFAAIKDCVCSVIQAEEALHRGPNKASHSQRTSLPRAGAVRRQLEQVIKGIETAIKALNEMRPEAQLTLDHYLEGTIVLPKFYNFYLSKSEQKVVERLLSSGRLVLALQAIRDSAESAKGPLCDHVQPVSEEAMRWLPKEVKEKVTRNSQMKPPRRGQNLFAYRGPSREEGIRGVMPRLCTIFQLATGKPPTVYKSVHKDGGRGGRFYEFAMAVLQPTRLAPKKSLPSRIHKAYDEIRPKKIKNP